MSDSQENQPAGEVEEPKQLQLRVKDSNGNEVLFRVKSTTKLSKLMDAYCTRVGKDRTAVRFLFDGERIKGDQTPADLEMEDNDEVDAMVEQQGGHQ
ncbi:MAG: hypothetical protein MHM6MM_008156 [Cercozoa sp. M6MM]